MKKRNKQSGKFRPEKLHRWTTASLGRALRQDVGLISWQTIQRIEKARGPVTEQQFAELARALGIRGDANARSMDP